jgi:GntR family histidine utilization transcriptional repressor
VRPQPFYQQVKTHVLEGIASGRYKPGDRIPSEHELVAALGWSRLTVNRALRELAATGVLHRVHGVGTFVAAPKVSSTFIKLHNIADDIRARGQLLSIRVLALDKIKATPEIATSMDVRLRATVFHSLIVYCADGVPMQIEDRHVSPGFAPSYLKQDFTQQSTTDYLQAIELPGQVEHDIQATLSNEQEAGMLDVTEPEAFLVVTRKTWVRGTVSSYTRFVHPGSRQRFFGRFTPSDVSAASAP